MAPSVETLVRVDLFWKIIPSDCPRRAVRKEEDWVHDLIAALCAAALRIKSLSSEGFRSAIDRRCRGLCVEVE